MVTGDVPHPTAMQDVQTSTGIAAQNDREVLEVTVCGDALLHVVAKPQNKSQTPHQLTLFAVAKEMYARYPFIKM